MLKTSSSSPILVQNCVVLGARAAGHSIPAGMAWLWGLLLCPVTRGVLEAADAQSQQRSCRMRGVVAPGSVGGALGDVPVSWVLLTVLEQGCGIKALAYIDLVGYYDFFFFFPPFNCIIPLKNGGK